MKAKQNFTVYVDDKWNLVPHYSGDSMIGKKEIRVKVGEDVPNEIAKTLIVTNPHYLAVEYEAGQFKLTEQEKKDLGISGKIIRPPIVPKERHSEESLIQLYNKKGREALEKLAFELSLKFKPNTNYNKLITMILKESEKRRRGG